MLKLKELSKFLGRFFAYFIFIALIIASGVLIHIGEINVRGRTISDTTWDNDVPYRPVGSYNYKFILDQHSHTNYSDGKLTVSQNIAWHKAMGFNVVVITDHGTMKNHEEIVQARQEYAGQMIIIQGIEIGTARGHINILGVTEWNYMAQNNWSDSDMIGLVQYAHNQGAVVTMDHIPWSTNESRIARQASRDEVLAWGIDYIEIVNDDSYLPNNYDSASVPFCDLTGIGQITGTDMHHPWKLQAKNVHGWTLLNGTEFTENAVMTELRARRTSIIYDPIGYFGPEENDPLVIITRPLNDIGSIFVKTYVTRDFNWLLTEMWLFLVITIFIIVEVYNAIRVRLWMKLNAWWQAKKLTLPK